MFPARLDHGLLRLLAMFLAVAGIAVLVNPGLPLLLVPAFVIAVIVAAVSYRLNQSLSWWRLPSVAFGTVSAITFAFAFYLAAQI